jgi:SAM-dependent methyltransferase
MKESLKKIFLLKLLAITYKTLKNKPGSYTKLKNLGYYFNDFFAYRRISQNKNFSLETSNLFPRIDDKTSLTQLDPIYFYQGVWCAKKVFELKPQKHYDIASQAIMVGIISEFVPTTMVDIRPLSVKLPHLDFIKGSLLELPFVDSSIESLSSICVIEHIGLGRYGDTLDPFGSEKSARELCRVLANNGSLYISVPVDHKNITYFNAHRAFTREYVLELFGSLKLIEEKYIYGNNMFDTYEPEKGFGTGLFHFKK